MKTETIKTTDGEHVLALAFEAQGCVSLQISGKSYTFDARNANQLARALRMAALQVEGEEKKKR